MPPVEEGEIPESVPATPPSSSPSPTPEVIEISSDSSPALTPTSPRERQNPFLQPQPFAAGNNSVSAPIENVNPYAVPAPFRTKPSAQRRNQPVTQPSFPFQHAEPHFDAHFGKRQGDLHVQRSRNRTRNRARKRRARLTRDPLLGAENDEYELPEDAHNASWNNFHNPSHPFRGPQHTQQQQHHQLLDLRPRHYHPTQQPALNPEDEYHPTEQQHPPIPPPPPPPTSSSFAELPQSLPFPTDHRHHQQQLQRLEALDHPSIMPYTGPPPPMTTTTHPDQSASMMREPNPPDFFDVDNSQPPARPSHHDPHLSPHRQELLPQFSRPFEHFSQQQQQQQQVTHPSMRAKYAYQPVSPLQPEQVEDGEHTREHDVLTPSNRIVPVNDGQPDPRYHGHHTRNGYIFYPSYSESLQPPHVDPCPIPEENPDGAFPHGEERQAAGSESPAQQPQALVDRRADQQREQRSDFFRKGPLPEQQPPVTQANPLLVQEPDIDPPTSPETPVTAMRPPEEPSAKPVKKASLLQLRKKVLMSIMQKKNNAVAAPLRNTDAGNAARSHDTSQPALHSVPSHPRGPDVSFSSPVQSGPHRNRNLFHNRIIVEWSETESDENSDSDAEDIDTDPGAKASLKRASTITRQHRPVRKRQRHEIIEDMKVRMVQLGGCPSSLRAKSRTGSLKTEERIENGSIVPVNEKGKASPPSSASVSKDEIMAAIPAVKSAAEQEFKSVDSASKQSKSEPLPSPNEAPTPSQNKGSDTGRGLEAKSQNDEDGLDHSSSVTASPVQKEVKADPHPPREGLVGSQEAAKIPVQAPSAKKCGLEKADIDTLRKRIAQLEQTRDAQKRTPTTRKPSNPSPSVISLKLGKSSSPCNEQANESVIIQAPGARAANSANVVRLNKLKQGNTGVPTSNEKGRYYSDEAFRKEKLEPRTPDVSVVNGMQSPSRASGAKLAEWNKSEIKEADSKAPTSQTEPGLVDDLKNELATSKRQLASVTDYIQLVHASDVSLAQASAKLNFKRNALANLQDLIKRAQFEVFDAEQDLEKIAKAAKRMRESLVDGPFSDMFPMPDIPSAKKVSSADHTVPGLENEAVVQIDAEAGDRMEVELDLSTRTDLVLQPSPYSPSTGDMFSSCLSGLRAFVLRVPYQSQASDRRSTSPLSLTWTHNLDPMKTICPKELRRQYSCSEKKCPYEHLRNFESKTGHALDVVDRVQSFVNIKQVPNAEKQVVRAKIDIYSHKNVDDTVSSLITSLFPIPLTEKLPLRKPT